MSINSMASALSLDQPDIESVKTLVISINHYIIELVSNSETWNSLKLRCTYRLKTVQKKHELFEFKEHSVLSNLYWGIVNIEAAPQSNSSEEKNSRLSNAETMLQVPALLDETGITTGITNQFLVCCSYFYLSVVRNLQGDEWQAAMHFLQALLVSPMLIRTEFAPELCQTLFPSSDKCGIQEMGSRRSSMSSSRKEFRQENASVSTSMMDMARRYKHWLMYCQVMFDGETPWRQNGCERISSPDIESYYFLPEGTSNGSANSKEHPEKIHSLNSEEQKTGRLVEKGTVVVKRNQEIKQLQDVLKEAQSDIATTIGSPSRDSEAEIDWEVRMEDTIQSITRVRENCPQSESYDQKLQEIFSTSGRKCADVVIPQCSKHSLQEVNELAITKFDSITPFNPDMEFSISKLGYERAGFSSNSQMETNTTNQRTLPVHKVQIKRQGSVSRKMRKFGSLKKECVYSGREYNNDLLPVLRRCISNTCFSERLGRCDEDYAVEVTTIYEMLNNKWGGKYTLLKDEILDQLLSAISTSREVTVIRTSVTILTTIISKNKSVVEDIKKKGLQLSHLASALKQNVPEAATLIYLINPSPAEIKSLELLPALLEVVCKSSSYNCWQSKLLVKPPAASVMIIEVLVTAFDYDTNNMHLAAINSPQILCGLLDVTRHSNFEEFISLATILVKCMQFDGQCRKYFCQFAPVAPFISLLQSNQRRAKFIALKYFHEILHIPRSSAVKLLQQMQKEGRNNIMRTLLLCVQQLQSDYQLLAADLLIQLDILESANGRSMFREEAMLALLNAVTSEESSIVQLSTFILSNISGTFAWTGEPYTIAWLVKKAGLTALHHRNMIRNVDWMDPSLQDSGVDSWCSKIARCMIDFGEPVYLALEKGLKSKIKRVSRDSLTVIAWLSYEIIRGPNSLRDSACELLLDGIEQFLHPGLDLEERFLACLCIYNYASGKGMKKLVHLSEAVRESLRRFSNVTWMADELHRVADYYLPNKSRISCVHTQILEASHNGSGAVTALIFYKGLLFGGYSNGSIKVWDFKGQSATLVLDTKEHKKAVTCFSLLEPGECLLSGSADKTIRVWQMVHKKLECTEVIPAKVPVQKLDTYGQMIFLVTQSHKLKVIDSSRKLKDMCKSKSVKSMRVIQGRIYAGCTDSSIQELSIMSNREREIKAATKSWRVLQSKPINSLVEYKDWLYSTASSIVEGSDLKDWRRLSEPQISIVVEKGANVLAMEMVEDFMYLNCSSSTSTLQIWLRNKQQKVGRISAGSKITSILTANDIILCGTENGFIKGWIPL